MNLVLLSQRDRTDGCLFRIRDQRAEHIRKVLALKAGDELRVGLVNGPSGRAEIVRIDDEGVDLSCELDGPAMPRPRVDLVLAICRPKALKRILRDVAMLGVDRLVLLRTWRVEQAYLDSPVLKPEIYEPALIDGLMQAAHTAMPEVSIHDRFMPFVQDVAPGFFETGTVELLAHPRAERALGSVRLTTNDRVALAIGPERGFTDFEVEEMERIGFVPVRSSDRTLRVETACVALLSQLEILRTLSAD